MNKHSNGVETQGVDTPTQETQVPDQSTIEKWMTRDLDIAINFLNAIRQDVELRKVMANWLQGRITNYQNRKDPAQKDLFEK